MNNLPWNHIRRTTLNNFGANSFFYLGHILEGKARNLHIRRQLKISPFWFYRQCAVISYPVCCMYILNKVSFKLHGLYTIPRRLWNIKATIFKKMLSTARDTFVGWLESAWASYLNTGTRILIMTIQFPPQFPPHISSMAWWHKLILCEYLLRLSPIPSIHVLELFACCMLLLLLTCTYWLEIWPNFAAPRKCRQSHSLQMDLGIWTRYCCTISRVCTCLEWLINLTWCVYWISGAIDGILHRTTLTPWSHYRDTWSHKRFRRHYIGRCINRWK